MLTGPAHGQCEGMTVSGDDIYITGRFDATFTIGTITLMSAGLSDVYVARLNGSGVVQTAFRFGSNAANEWSNAIAIASNGDVLVVGAYDSGTADIGGRSLVKSWICRWVLRALPRYRWPKHLCRTHHVRRAV